MRISRQPPDSQPTSDSQVGSTQAAAGLSFQPGWEQCSAEVQPEGLGGVLGVLVGRCGPDASEGDEGLAQGSERQTAEVRGDARQREGGQEPGMAAGDRRPGESQER